MGVKHYLSQTYLIWFSIDENHIFCYDKIFKEFITTYTISLDQITCSKRGNSPRKPWTISKLWCKPDNFWTQDIEDEMTKIETNFPSILLAINQKNSDNDIHNKLIQFTSLQLLRSLVSQESFERRVNNDKESMNKICDIIEFEKWKLLLEGYNPKNNRNLILKEFIDWIVNQSSKTYSHLRNRALNIYCTNNAEFITWDFPFYHFYAEGIQEPNIFFPISQNIIIVLWEKKRGWDIIYGASSVWSQQAISDMNKKLIYAAERYVFGSDPELILSLL